ncbi:MAG: SufB/SufD family protein [Ruminococcus sp.]
MPDGTLCSGKALRYPGKIGKGAVVSTWNLQRLQRCGDRCRQGWTICSSGHDGDCGGKHRGYPAYEIGSEDGGDCAAFANVQAESGSDLTLVQIWKANASHAALRTVVRAESGARVRLIQILADASEESINDVGCVTGEKASFEVIRLYLSKGNVISGIRTDLAGNGSSFTHKTGYLVQPGKKLDMNVIANHIGKNTESDIRAEGTLYDSAEKAFRGTIDLKRGCAGSEGKEEENVLLLGDDVINKTIPLILCTEEDVKGSHGASIGELEQGMLFYFEARGISREEAEKIVAKARLERLCQDTEDAKTAEYMHQIIEEVI